MEFVRNSGWLSRNPGALCPVVPTVILGGPTTKKFLTDRIREKENEIKDLKRKVKDLEEKEMFAKAASEMKNLRNRFVEAGFTEDEAFHMVLELSKMALGIGGRK